MNAVRESRPDHSQNVGHLAQVALEAKSHAVNRHGIQARGYHEQERFGVHVTHVDAAGVPCEDPGGGNYRIEGYSQIESQDVDGAEGNDAEGQGPVSHSLHHLPNRPVPAEHRDAVDLLAESAHQLGGMPRVPRIENPKRHSVPFQELDHLGQMKIEKKAPSRFGIDDQYCLHPWRSGDRNARAEEARPAAISRLRCRWIRLAIRWKAGMQDW